MSRVSQLPKNILVEEIRALRRELDALALRGGGGGLGGGGTGATGAPGAPGANGKTVLNGIGAPFPGVGVDGDFYIDTNAWVIYGPKAGGWGAGTSLIGPAGSGGGAPSGNDGQMVGPYPWLRY